MGFHHWTQCTYHLPRYGTEFHINAHHWKTSLHNLWLHVPWDQNCHAEWSQNLEKVLIQALQMGEATDHRSQDLFNRNSHSLPSLNLLCPPWHTKKQSMWLIYVWKQSENKVDNGNLRMGPLQCGLLFLRVPPNEPCPFPRYSMLFLSHFPLHQPITIL